jgi:hypothetical protein
MRYKFIRIITDSGPHYLTPEEIADRCNAANLGRALRDAHAVYVTPNDVERGLESQHVSVEVAMAGDSPVTVWFGAGPEEAEIKGDLKPKGGAFTQDLFVWMETGYGETEFLTPQQAARYKNMEKSEQLGRLVTSCTPDSIIRTHFWKGQPNLECFPPALLRALFSRQGPEDERLMDELAYPRPRPRPNGEGFLPR